MAESDTSRLEERGVRDAYGIALLLVLVSTLALIAAGTPVASPLTVGASLLQVVALVVTLRVSGVHRRWSTIGAIVAVALFIGAVAAVAILGPDARTPGIALWLALTLVTIGAIAKRLATYRCINLQMILGLLVIYLLLGVVFGLSYLLVTVNVPTAFVQGEQGVSGCLYFSYVTLATLGYGDVTPAIPLARAIAVAEAVVGQLYLVSVVSLAVSRLGSTRPERPARAAE